MTIVGVILLAGVAVQSSQWSYRLEWEHDGASTTHFELCVDNECRSIDAARTGSRTWSAAVPILTVGFHTLVVSACNNAVCTPGTPSISVNVTPGPVISPPNQPPPTPPPTPPAPGRKAPPRRPPKT
jgi:hypothetical protein